MLSAEFAAWIDDNSSCVHHQCGQWNAGCHDDVLWPRILNDFRLSDVSTSADHTTTAKAKFNPQQMRRSQLRVSIWRP